MKLNLEIDSSNKKDLAEAAAVIALLQGGKATAPVVTGKSPKKPKEEVIEDEEEPNFEEDESEEEFGEDEVETEEDEGEEETEEEDEDEKPAPKKGGKAAAPATGGKLKLEDVVAAFQATHKKLEKKLKSKEKAQAKLNAVLKKHGAKGTRSLDAKKYATVIKEVKALAA